MTNFNQNLPRPDVTVSATETPWAVLCPSDGQVFLTEPEYNRQAWNPDNFWECPRCGAAAGWDDDNYEKHYPPDSEE